jgi:Phage P2 GpE
LQEVEANLFVVFPGWTPDTTARMDIDELMRWHQLAEARTQKPS